MKKLLVLVGILVLGLTVVSMSEENNLSEKDKIVTNLSKRSTAQAEVERVIGIRNTQINALLEVVNNHQQAMVEDREWTGETGEAAINLLGNLRAAEAVKPLINFMCFIMDERIPFNTFNERLAFTALESAVYNALVKIGKPATEPLITLLREGASRTHFPKGLTEEGRKMIGKDETPKLLKYRLARMTLCFIEGDCVIHRLEKVLNDEADKQKKENLFQAITKIREELKSGVYDKLMGSYKFKNPYPLPY